MTLQIYLTILLGLSAVLWLGTLSLEECFGMLERACWKILQVVSDFKYEIFGVCLFLVYTLFIPTPSKYEGKNLYFGAPLSGLDEVSFSCSWIKKNMYL